MGNPIQSRMAGTDWPLAYFIITAISIGVLVGVRHWFPEPPGDFELVPVGLIAGTYAVTSALHYYHATRGGPANGVAVIDERTS